MGILNTPKNYENDYGSLKKSGKEIKSIGNNALIISGKTAFDKVKKTLLHILNENKINYNIEIFKGYPTIQKIKQYSKAVKINNNNVVIGIGGGRALDLSKAVANEAKVPVITIPTIPATCAAWSALSIIYKDNGEQDLYIYLENSPELIIADKDILINSPIRYINSGVSDSIAKWYEISPDLKKNKNNFALRLQVKICELALEFLLKDYINSYKNKSLLSKKYILENAVDSIIMLAGLSGSIKGSVPYGGLAHPFYNNSTKIQDTLNLLHGEKVAFGLLVQLVLEKRSDNEIEEYIEWISLLNQPVTLKELGIKHDIERKIEIIAEGIIKSDGNYSALGYKLTKDNLIAAIKKVDLLGNHYLKNRTGSEVKCLK